MDKRINALVEAYVVKFKDDIRDKICSMNLDNAAATDLVGFVYEYERLVISKDDVTKRMRVKNTIPGTNRCSAKRATGEQCTRRRTNDSEFCGTHHKSAPHGLMSNEEELQEFMKSSNQRIEVFAEDVNGIIYHVDKFSNVYNTEDILLGCDNPRIIGSYKKPGIVSFK
jgi:hypothetical protein